MSKVRHLPWRVNTPGLFQEIVLNPQCAILLRPLQITGGLLAQVAQRAVELNDPIMNGLMAQLALYEVTDPNSKQYKPRITERLINRGLAERSKLEKEAA